MEELRLNDAQKSAIEKQGSNILVSAAAGSGKTTVLVERVLKKIIEDRISIDEKRSIPASGKPLQILRMTLL